MYKILGCNNNKKIVMSFEKIKLNKEKNIKIKEFCVNKLSKTSFKMAIFLVDSQIN